MGLSSIMGSINIVATVWNLRAPGMTWMKMPLFVWTWLITAFLLIAVMPVLAGAVTMMLTDRNFGTSFFDAAGGGDPVTAHLDQIAACFDEIVHQGARILLDGTVWRGPAHHAILQRKGKALGMPDIARDAGKACLQHQDTDACAINRFAASLHGYLRVRSACRKGRPSTV